jgi:hypothetical protein
MAAASPLILTSSTELGDAWAGNSVNCAPYRLSPLLRQDGQDIVSFYDGDGQVIILRTGPDGTSRAVIPNDRLPFDAHQAISLGADAEGTIHVAFGAHVSTLLVARSRAAGIAQGFTPATPYPPQTGAEARPAHLTYPMFIRTGAECLLVYRSGGSPDGALFVSRRDAGSGEWQADAQPFVNGRDSTPTSGPYLNTPVVHPDGSVTCFLVWRLPAQATSAGAVVNSGIDCFRTRNGFRSLETFRGVALTPPINRASSERIVAVPLGASLMNQASAALMPDGRPAVITYWDLGDGVPQYRMAWPEGTGWRVAQVSNFKTAFALDGRGTLPLPHSRPELLFDDDGRAYVVFRSIECHNQLMLRVLDPPHYDWQRSRDQSLVSRDLGFYEPVISRAAWVEDRRLVVFIQSCQQHFGHDGVADRALAPAMLCRWRLSGRQTSVPFYRRLFPSGWRRSAPAV